MKHHRYTPNLLAVTLLVISALACKTITNIASPNQPPASTSATSAPAAPSSDDRSLSPDRLVTKDELNSFSTDIGITDWKLTQETPGQNRVCRSFQGTSWSVSPNEGMNCIFKTEPGSSLDSAIKSMFSDGNLVSGEQPVNSTLKLDNDFAVYAGDYPNGHGVFDLILMKNGLVYWSSVTLGIAVGSTPLDTYNSAPEVIDTFLANIIKINLQSS